MSLDQYQDSKPCTCKTCKSYCSRPCWPTPEEVEKLIVSGRAGRLMLDFWVGDLREGIEEEEDKREYTYLISPANPGYEGEEAPDDFSLLDMLSSFASSSTLNSGCTFQDKDGLCQLHSVGLKPIEGRVAHHNVKCKDLHKDVASAWATSEGERIVALWCGMVGIDNPYQEDGLV